MSKQRISTGLFAGLIASLLMLVGFRPWGQFNQVVGIASAMDTFRADSTSNVGRDSLMVEEVAITLPDMVSDSLTHSVEARQKKRAFLEEQSAWLQKENQKLDAEIKKKKLAYQQKQQTLISLSDIDALLSRQNPNGKQNAKHLEVSDLETELNQRSPGKSNRSDP